MRYNGNKFSVYESEEKTVLGLLDELGSQVNHNTDNFKNKTDLHGDHKGSWQGLSKPTLSEEGMRATVEKINEVDIPKLNEQLENIVHRAEQLILNIEDFPRLALETDDSPRIQRAIDSITKPTKVIFPLTNYLIKTQININKSNIIFEGNGFDTILLCDTDEVMFYVTKNYNKFSNFTLKTNNPNRTKYTIECKGCVRPEIERVYFDGIDGKSLSGLNLIDGSMAIVDKCIFNHSSILVNTWDTKITNTWVWSLSKDFGIKATKGCGNLTITNTDIVPPLTSNLTREAGIVLDSSNGVVSNIKIINCYIDGNPTLETGKGIVITPNTFGVQIKDFLANKCNEDVITIDSAYSIDINGQFFDNNNTNLGGRDIFITKNNTQSCVNINIDTQHIMNSSKTLPKPAIEINDNANNDTITISAKIKNTSSGDLGYSTPEIVSNRKNKFSNCIGGRRIFGVKGTIPVTANDTSITINFPFALQYDVLPTGIKLGLELGALPQYRIISKTLTQLQIGFQTAITSTTILHYEIAV